MTIGSNSDDDTVTVASDAVIVESTPTTPPEVKGTKGTKETKRAFGKPKPGTVPNLPSGTREKKD